MTNCYLFSRKDWPELATIDPVSLATSVFFQMWLKRAYPYNALGNGDVVYIVMRQLDVLTPRGFKFGQNGYRALRPDERGALGLPAPKKRVPLATPPAWYDPTTARTGTVRSVPRDIPLPVREAVMARDGHRCVGCGATTNLHLDHIHPWSHGGASTVDNLRVVCTASNLAKGADVAGIVLACAA